MKVLYLVRRLREQKAATEHIKNLAECLVSKNHEALVVSFDDGSEYSINDEVEVNRVDLPFEADNLYNWSMMLNNELKREARERFDDRGFDIIHVVDWTSIPGGATLSQHLDIPLVVTYQSTENERGFNSDQSGVISELEWQGGCEADKVFATGEDTKNSLLFDLDVPSEKLEVINPFSSDWQGTVLSSYKELVKQEKEVKQYR